MTRIHGSYSLTIMHDDTVLGVRDPQGNRPLCIGELEDGYIIASESAAIDVLDGDLVRDVKPGELVVLQPDGDGVDTYQLVDGDNTAHCFFEHVYFARPDSRIDDNLVYDVRRELNPITDVVEGRTVTVIDDSIVRGTTSSQLVKLLRDVGAEAVHLRIGAPPIVAPCYMGIDMASREELIAAGRDVEDIRSEIDADSLSYLSIDAVAAALEETRADLCLGCVTGEYPYDIDGEATDREVSRPDLDGADAGIADD